MTPQAVLRAALGVAALALAGFGAWIVSLPPAPAAAAAPAIPREEGAAALAALRPPKRGRPVVAIVGINDATEVTDYLLPYGILKRADVAEVVALATGPGPVKLYPALTVEPDATLAEFDARHPEGADYVVVPQMEPNDDAAALAWIRGQAEKGATVIGVCAGAVIVGKAGLLDGKRATTHWYYVGRLRDENPKTRYVADRRLVVDRGIATTTGVTASAPMALTLVEAIAGREKAASVARDLGIAAWDARHASAAFRFNRRFALTVLGNVLAFWNRETLGIELAAGIDETSLALVADAWSRTYRSRAVTFSAGAGAVESRSGIRIIPDETRADWPAARLLPAIGDRPPMQALDDALEAIAERYGQRTTDVVAMQLEYTGASRGGGLTEPGR